ncbi:MAG TPA: ABC transporter permease [Chthoniobacteraceae bacterium]|nr:ABC transporter permease [Chthoniobacteraceae bacterium]
MKAPFSLFLALRYLRPKRTFVSIITLISIAGVTLGIMVLIVVISVMTGFDRELQRVVLGFEPHLTVTNGQLLANWRELLPMIEQTPGVVAAAPYVQGPVLAEHEGQVYTPMLRGINLDAEQKIIDLKKTIVEGSADLESDTVILGTVLASSLGVGVGDTITVYAPGNINGVIEELRRERDDPQAKKKTLAELKDEIVLPSELRVVGLFESGRNSYDATVLLVPLFVAQELYILGDAVHGISVKTTSPDAAEQVKQALDAKTGDAWAETWFEKNRERFDAVRLERHVMFIILMFLVIIAAFGITSTLITVTVQKRREIGILMALGANTTQIVWVFLAQGMFVGFFGNVTGLALGMTLITYRNPFKEWLSDRLGIEIFPPGIYELKGIPAEVVPRDVAIICVSAFIICSLAALFPAYAAARLDPVKALRYE